ncbi:hypothetical protein FHETE_10491 [Fusarium heterosporum]|uniref:Uncharacterized protein n=1 Tax=Fusarium heterosporum TaxID=42747 RepID=A0A8H5SUK3_FUSHE|nr:hypothetical protein FHETE_10491 [Fusarium heterosporum]
MDLADKNESNSDSSMSLTSSIFAEHRDAPLFNFYSFDRVMDGENYEHPAPPTANISMSTILEGTAAIRSSYVEDDDVSLNDWTIINSPTASETTCPAPISVSAPSMADLTASGMLRAEPQDTRPSDSAASPGSHVAQGRASDNLEDLMWMSVQDDDDNEGLCGIGAWADIAASPLVAKKMRITPRQ